MGNEPPEITPEEDAFSILETVTDGTEVFTVEATDPDGDNEAITYSFTEDYPFAIDDGVVTVADSEELEADDSFELEVEATDELGASSTETFTVEIDPNLPPNSMKMNIALLLLN
ncbi:cadherin repeat domain-containing protein (plasmid) [Euhalothece natronophila Z-M001]|uniref:Cadherin repeat domain-containing protein n=1 Tax=Euhalothece natronophila Z-M001 TaxID=522448 RepID=A0A5B8NRK4_9CHRO|nr:cadherin domain-containing protein [Euhalothece natronophila]QDZ41658.1 cadherin repeat domain-containing protein [Euhalothece natronophila Z-M001]